MSQKLCYTLILPKLTISSKLAQQSITLQDIFSIHPADTNPCHCVSQEGALPEIAALTPTFRRDIKYFELLHESVLRFTPNNVCHHIIIPDEDIALFSGWKSSRLAIHTTRSLLPKGFLSISALSKLIGTLPYAKSLPALRALSRGELFLDIRSPWPPIRGWVLQQILKFAAVGSMNVDAVLMLDSDVVLVNRISSDDLVHGGAVRFYRKPKAILPEMTKHIAWHETARRILGIPERLHTEAADYVPSFLVWDPSIVRAIQKRLEEVNQRDWSRVLARELTVSEWTIYGSYVDHLGTDTNRSFVSSNSLCSSYWDASALNRDNIARFVASVSQSDLAILVQSTSGTSQEIRKEIVETVLSRFARQQEMNETPATT